MPLRSVENFIVYSLLRKARNQKFVAVSKKGTDSPPPCALRNRRSVEAVRFRKLAIAFADRLKDRRD